MPHLVFVVVALALAGCAVNDFKRLDSSTIELGRTDRQSVIEAVGNPEGGETRNINSIQGEPAEQVTHFIAKRKKIPNMGTVRLYREQALVFHKRVLVGYTFISGFPGESTFFDERMVKFITPGSTTVEQVIKLLGRPAGERIYPMTCGGSAKDLIYKYYYGLKIWLDENFQFDYSTLTKKSKTLSILINNDGVVMGLILFSTGNAHSFTPFDERCPD